MTATTIHPQPRAKQPRFPLSRLRTPALGWGLFDWLRERRISRHHRDFLAAKTEAAQRSAWTLMRREILARSPAQVARMERARGLA